MWSLLALQPSNTRLDQQPANDNEPSATLVSVQGYPAAPPVVIEIEEGFVSVTFCSDRRYRFGRLTNSDDVSRFGPLCRRQCADDHLESLAYTFALRAVAN